jgi:hypothetical protein
MKQKAQMLSCANNGIRCGSHDRVRLGEFTHLRKKSTIGTKSLFVGYRRVRLEHHRASLKKMKTSRDPLWVMGG